ncbi:MAG: lipopolysaccharide biosynthesis protein [Parasphingorhabdus sp.]
MKKNIPEPMPAAGPQPGEIGYKSSEDTGFRARVRNAVIWRSGTQIFGQIVSWVSTFLVIRILDPSDYGLVAMTAVLTLLLSLVNGYGFANAVVQREAIDSKILQQLFGLLILFNAGLATIQIGIAPFAAEYYQEPLVADLLRVQALLYLTTPFVVLGYTVLSRKMDFKRQAQVNIVAAFCGAIAAIAGAFAGLGVWTLVWAPLIVAFVRAIGMTIAAKSWMWPSFNFNGAGFIVKYGGVILIGHLFWFIQTQADVFIVGRQFDAHALGIYTTALFLTQIFINKVVPPLNEVAFSAYSRIDGEDGVARAFVKSVQMIMLVGLPIFVGFAVTAEPLVKVLLGEKWVETIAFVELLALAMPFMTLLTLVGPACNAINRPDITTRNSIVGAVYMPICYLIGLNWGVIGIAYAWLIGYPILLATIAIWTLPVVKVRLSKLIDVLLPSITAALAMAASVILIDRLIQWPSEFVQLPSLVAIGGLVYLGWMMIFSRKTVVEIYQMIRNQG